MRKLSLLLPFVSLALVACSPSSNVSPDAGESVDVGVSPDAGVTPDAGESPDAGMTPDAGESPDAGVASPSDLTYATNPVVYTVGQRLSDNAPSSSGGAVGSYAVVPELPAGIAFDPATGVLSGTPAVLAPANNYTVTATNAAGSTTATLNLTVVDVPPSELTYGASPVLCTLGQPLAALTPSSVGGAVVLYEIAPALPAGLSIDATTGVLSGTPTGLSTQTNYAVTATNSGGSTTATVSLAVVDVPPAALTYATNPTTYTIGQPLPANEPSISGGAVVLYEITPPLPAGLSFDATTGVISGMPLALSPATDYTVTATNSGGSTTATLTLSVVDVPPAELTYGTNPAVYTIGQAISENAPSSSGGPVVSYAITPALPAGLSLDATTGVLSGTPTVPSPATEYTVTATNSGGSTNATLTLTVNDLALTNLSYDTNPATYYVGTAITPNTPSNGGGTVVTYSISPVLPSGLHFDTVTGAITGTPSAWAPAANYTVTASNSAGSTTASVNITVRPAICTGTMVLGDLPAVAMGVNPTSMFVGDLNGDGKPDLAVTSSFIGGLGVPASNAVGVRLSNGNGTFAARVDYQMGSGANPVSVTAGDLNGDGKPDLAVANGSNNTVSVLINNGNGTFAAKVNYPAGTSPSSVTAGDLNGDGMTDLAVANSSSNTVSVLINNGNGTFAAKVDYPTGTKPASVTAGDLNGDGKPDLAVANASSDTVSVLLNNGNGTFAAKVDSPTGAKPSSVVVGDLNGDGKPDLAAVNLFGGTVSVLINSGNGTFAAKVDSAVGSEPQSVTVGDLNGDGKLDLAVANSNSSTVSALLNNGNGTFAARVDYPTGAKPVSVMAGDLNGDGKPDLAVANAGSDTVSLVINNGNGSFAIPVDYPAGNQPQSVTTGDLNGDGKPDLVVVNAPTNTVSALLNNGNGTFAAKVDYPTGTNPGSVTAGDLNGDGALDLAVANSTSNTVSVLINNRNGTFAAKVDYAASVVPVWVKTGDFNGDSKADLVVVNKVSNTVSVLLNNGDGTFAAKVDYPVAGLTPLSLEVLDLNSDGKPDLVVPTTSTPGGPSNPYNVSLFVNNGDGTFTALTPLSPFFVPAGIAAGDVDGDGKSDLILGRKDLQVVTVWKNNGNGTFTGTGSYAVSGLPTSIAMGDLNADGKADLAVVSGGTTVSVLPGNGNGTFGTKVDYLAGVGPQSVVMSDLNGDGELDLATANSAGVGVLLQGACLP